MIVLYALFETRKICQPTDQQLKGFMFRVVGIAQEFMLRVVAVLGIWCKPTCF